MKVAMHPNASIQPPLSGWESLDGCNAIGAESTPTVTYTIDRSQIRPSLNRHYCCRGPMHDWRQRWQYCSEDIFFSYRHRGGVTRFGMASKLDGRAGPSEERKDSNSSAQLTPRITCQLCSEPYKEPRILPCLHSFCGQCLHKKIERSGARRNLECPTCQRSITIPEGGVNAIPQNLHLGFEVEVAGYMSKIGSDGEKSCDACIDGSTGPAVVFCSTCHELLCSYCYESHKRSRKLSSHVIVGLEESRKMLPSIMKLLEHFCSQPHHEKEELQLYCETCQLTICRDCTLVLHKDHRITEICNIAKVKKDAMKEVLAAAQEVTSKLVRTIDANDKITEQFDTCGENSTLTITKAFEQLHQAIEERKKTLLSEMKAILVSKKGPLTLQKEKLTKAHDEIGRYTEMTSNILQTHTDHEIVALGDLLPTELKASLNMVENVSLTPNQTICDIHVSLHTDSVINEVSLLGHVMDTSPSPSQSTWSSESVAKVKEMYCVKVQTISSKRERYPHGGLQVKAELRPKSRDGAVVPGTVEDHRDGTYTITLTPQTGGPHQLLITMDDQHVQKSPYDLDVRKNYSTLSNAEQVINCNGGPDGIAIHESGDIYVACCRDNTIRVFNQAGQQKKTIGSKGSGDGQFSVPCGLFIKGDVIYVADYGNHRIQRLTTEGQFLKKFGQRGTGQGQFQYPGSVIVDQRDRMIVADYYNHRVVILDQAGTWLLTINGHASGSRGFLLPYGLALDPQGNIHVAAWGTSTINVFKPEGNYVRSYGSVNGPSGIVMDGGGCSLVNELTGNCLSIFDHHGNKVHTVYNLNGPRGVILDPKSGDLYVTNYGANTVLKYFML
eukprot:Em0065g16a